jgi:hypothetical protein
MQITLLKEYGFMISNKYNDSTYTPIVAIIDSILHHTLIS